MLVAKKFYLIGFISSLFIYLLALSALGYQFASSQKAIDRFTAKKENFMDVTIIEKKQQQKRPEVEKSAPKKPVGAKSAKPTHSQIDSLFASINTKNLPVQVQNTTKKPPAAPSRLKGEEKEVPKSTAASILDNMNIKKQSDFNSTSANAKYDAFIGGVADILDANWQNSIDMPPGPEAEVMIVVNSFGEFSYNIVSLSKNEQFDEELKDFLERMTNEKFPPYDVGDKNEFRFNTFFKIDWE